MQRETYSKGVPDEMTSALKTELFSVPGRVVFQQQQLLFGKSLE